MSAVMYKSVGGWVITASRHMQVPEICVQYR